MLMDPHPSLQHAGLHHAVCQLQQQVIRTNAKFKPTSPYGKYFLFSQLGNVTRSILPLCPIHGMRGRYVGLLPTFWMPMPTNSTKIIGCTQIVGKGGLWERQIVLTNVIH